MYNDHLKKKKQRITVIGLFTELSFPKPRVRLKLSNQKFSVKQVRDSGHD